MTPRDDKARVEAGFIETAIAWENERQNRSAQQNSAQPSPTLADFERVRAFLRVEAPHLQCALYQSPDGFVLEIYGRAPRSAALRKIRRGRPIPAVRWRTPHGGLYAVDLAGLQGLVAGARRVV